jgi:hypothetical protein
MLERRVIEVGDTLGASRILGALLCIATVVVIILHIYYGYFTGAAVGMGLSFALPVTVGLLVVCGLGFWLGWIMATTREVSPSPPPAKSEGKESEQSAPEK